MTVRTASAILLVLFNLEVAEAKGRFERVTIVPPGSLLEIQVTDPQLLSFFGFSRFPDQHLDSPPTITTEAYVVTRGGFAPDGSFQVFDRLHYYPGEPTGTPGYVFYDGLVEGRSEYDKQWYTASAEGDRAMSRLIASQMGAKAKLAG